MDRVEIPSWVEIRDKLMLEANRLIAAGNLGRELRDVITSAAIAEEKCKRA